MEIEAFGRKLDALQVRLSGDPMRGRMEESQSPGIWSRIYQIVYGTWSTIQEPTQTHRRNLQIATKDYASLRTELDHLLEVEMVKLFEALYAAGAPAIQ